MGTLDHIDRIGDSIAAVRAWQGRRARVQARADSFTDDDVIRLSQYGRLVPNTPFGVLEALVKEKFDPDATITRQIINANYNRNAEMGDPSGRGTTVFANLAANMDRWRQAARIRKMDDAYMAPVIESQAFQKGGLIRRLSMIERARLEAGRPLSYKDQLIRRGIFDPKSGEIRMPANRQYEGRKPNGDPIWRYDSKFDEDSNRLFFELMATIAHDQGTNDDIPFVGQDGTPGFYHPRTRKVSYQNPRDENILGVNENIRVEGVLGDLWARGQDQVEDWMNRRLPTAPGAPDYEVAGPGFPHTPKTAIRNLAMVGEAGIQEGYGVVRNAYGFFHGENVDWTQSQSDLGVYLGSNKSPGEGLLVDPESEVAEERKRRERERGLIGGHAVTPGRWIADTLPLSVDSLPFDLVSGSIDFAAQVFADPVVLGAKGTAAISARRRMFEPDEANGLFRGIRNQFRGDTWATYRQTDKGQAAVDAIVHASGDNSSPYDIWTGFKRKIDPELAARLYDADDVEKADEVFKSVIGSQIRNKHDLDRLPARMGTAEGLRNLPPQWNQTRMERLTQMLPDYHIDATNKMHAAVNMERFLKVGKAGDDVIKDVFNQIARSDSKNGIEQAVEFAMEAENGILAAHGVRSAQRRRELTRLFTQSRSRAVDALMDEVTADTPIRDLLMANGIAVQDLSPQLTVEYLNRFIPLPDVTRISRVLADPKYRWLLTNMNSNRIGKPRWPESLLQFVTEEFWKPAMLLGRFPAWISRVVGEEQLRMAMAGVDGIFNHPVSALSIAVGRKIKTTPSGDIFDELQEFQGALTRTHGGLIRRPGATRSTPVHFDKENVDQSDDFLHAWADQVALLHYDPVSRQLLNTDVEQTVTWLKGKGRNKLRELREAEPGKFDTDAGIRTYLTETLGERIRVLTNDNPDLIEAAKNGKLGEAPMFKKGGPKLTSDYVADMSAYLDDAPRLVKGFEYPQGTLKTIYDNAIDAFFAGTMSRATNFASRSPAFKQFLWRNTADILPHASDDVKKQVLANAKAANLSNRLMRQVEKRAARQGEVQIESIEELEHLAAGYALDDTKGLLYDLSNRGQLAESLKVIAPFGNAYQEIITTWPKLLLGSQYGWTGKFANVARASRRVQQTIEGGRRNGWFMKNQFGEEVFVFPFSEMYTKALTGVPVPMTGRVAGLNMVTDVFPGMGPVAAIPVAWMIEGKPGTWKDVYDRLLPYGAPGERDPNQAFNFLSYAPSWVQKFALAVSAGAPPILDAIPGVEANWPTKDEVMWDHNAWMNTQKDVMKYLISTGDYDIHTREGMQKLTEDAKEKATDLYYIRAGLQFFAPTAPAFEFLVEDKSGQRIAQWAVTEEFYNMLDEEGMTLDEATIEMLDKYGTEVFSLTVPKTRSATFNVPRTAEAAEWLTQNKGIRDKYPGVYGLFAPQGGELDYSVLVDQYATGDVEVLTPGEWLNLRNDMLKSLEYNYYRDQVGNSPSDEEEQWLRQIRADLEEAYPSSTKGLLEKPSYEELIPELYEAVEDPQLADTRIAQATREYFYYRDQAMDFAIENEYAGFARPNALYPTREWLAGIAKDIMKDYPEFELVWSTTLSREFERELR